MGVEPTTARSARPVTGVEDRGIHRDTTTPNSNIEIYPSIMLRATSKLHTLVRFLESAYWDIWLLESLVDQMRRTASLLDSDIPFG